MGAALHTIDNVSSFYTLKRGCEKDGNYDPVDNAERLILM
jgi:hypothetical protein